MCESPAKSAVAENGGITLLARMALFKVSITCKRKQTRDKNVNKPNIFLCVKTITYIQKIMMECFPIERFNGFLITSVQTKEFKNFDYI